MIKGLVTIKRTKEKFIKEYEFIYGFLLSLSVIGLIFPYGFPLLTIVIVLFFSYSILKKKVVILMNVGTISLLILIFLYIFGMGITFGKVYRLNVQDLSSAISIIILILLSGNARQTSLKSITNYFFLLLTIFTPLLAIFSLYKYSQLSNGIKLLFLEIEGREYPMGTSLMPDYNMYALGMILGIIGVIYMTLHSNSIVIKIYSIGSIFLISYSVYLSGSRRGLIVLAIVLLYVLFVLIKTIFSNSLRGNLYIAGFFSAVIIFLTLNSDIKTFIGNQNNELEKIQFRYSTLNNLDGALSSRQDRWNYGLELINDFKIHNYIIGDGFGYIEKFGKEFNVLSGVDYPHNIFISSFLYSGIIGTTLLIFLCSIPLIRFFENRLYFPKEMLLVYVILLLFLVISGNSFLSINIMWLILTLLTTIKLYPDKITNLKGADHD